jgi:hypothetical protein
VRVFIIHDEEGRIVSFGVPESEFASDAQLESPEHKVVEITTDELENLGEWGAEGTLEESAARRSEFEAKLLEYRVETESGRLIR